VAFAVSAVFAQDRNPKGADRIKAEERKALVIGNARYGKGDLANPVNDAKAVAQALKKVGFKVTLKKNLKKRGIREAVSTFARSLGAGDVALFFYAGHGIEIDGQNYLLGVDFGADSEVDAKDEAYRMGTMLEHLSKRQGGLNIVIIDACRDDPYSRSWGRTGKGRGLAVVARVPPETYIAFSAEPGQIASDGAGAKNSPFSKALVKHLSTAGLELNALFRAVRGDVQRLTSNKQSPMSWEKRVKEFFFKASAAKPAVAPAPEVAAPSPAPAPEIAAPSPAPAPVATTPLPASAPVVATPSLTSVGDHNSPDWVWSQPAGLYFARTETTVAQYADCVKAGSCTASHHRTNSDKKYCNWGSGDRVGHPMNCVNWHGAQAYCEWAGARLPTAEEWSAEASAGGSREYPWGDGLADCRFSVMDDGKTRGSAGTETDGCGEDSTWPVCSKPAGNSVSGLCDMSGNVWEWTSSWFDEQEEYRVIYGGSWYDDDPHELRATYRGRGAPARAVTLYGFRCVRSSL